MHMEICKLFISSHHQIDSCENDHCTQDHIPGYCFFKDQCSPNHSPYQAHRLVRIGNCQRKFLQDLLPDHRINCHNQKYCEIPHTKAFQVSLGCCHLRAHTAQGAEQQTDMQYYKKPCILFLSIFFHNNSFSHNYSSNSISIFAKTSASLARHTGRLLPLTITWPSLSLPFL